MSDMDVAKQLRAAFACRPEPGREIMLEAADKLDSLRKRLEIAERALERLEEAADYFAADQSRATDPRCGLVQPVSVAECEELNQAIMQARSALSAMRAGKRGEA